MSPSPSPSISGRLYRELLVQLRSLLGAGMPVAEALASIERPARARAVAAALHDRIRAGATLADAFEAERVGPPAHIAWIGASEESGHVPEAMEEIVADIDASVEARRLLLAQAAYPLVVLIVALVVAPLTLGVVTGGMPAGTVSYIALFVVAGFVAACVAFGPRWIPHGTRLRALFEAAAFRSPWIGTTLRARVWGRLFQLLGRLVHAGVGLDRGLEVLEGATVWERARRDVRLAREGLRAGRNLAASLARGSTLPADRIGRIRSGEQAGEVDRALRVTGDELLDAYRRRLEVGLRVVPIVLYLLAVLAVLRMGLQVFGQLSGRVALGSAIAVVALSACRAVPPRVDVGSASAPAAVASGWPPRAVYTDDPFHPADLWFHRVYSPRTGDTPRQLARAATAADRDAPLAEWSAVDRAEVAVLLEELAEVGLPADTPAERRAALVEDLDRSATVWAAQGEGELARLASIVRQSLSGDGA